MLAPVRQCFLAIAALLLLLGCAVRSGLELGASFGGHEWVVVQPYGTGHPNWDCVHGLMSTWRVSPTGPAGVLRATRHETRFTSGMDSLVFEVAEGRFLAVDSEESGAGLFWIPLGASIGERIADEPIRLFLQGPDGLLAVAGSGRMMMRVGHLLGFERSGDHWTVRRLLDLGDFAQTAILVAPDTILVVTLSHLFTVSLGSLHFTRDDFHGWYASYATSVSRDARGVIYIGLRQGIARLTPIPGGLREELLVHPQCVTLAQLGNGPRCECRA